MTICSSGKSSANSRRILSPIFQYNIVNVLLAVWATCWRNCSFKLRTSPITALLLLIAESLTLNLKLPLDADDARLSGRLFDAIPRSHQFVVGTGIFGPAFALAEGI